LRGGVQRGSLSASRQGSDGTGDPLIMADLSITTELNISLSMVDKHVQAVYAKLEVDNKSELMQPRNANHTAVKNTYEGSGLACVAITA